MRTQQDARRNVILIRNNERNAFGGGEIYQLMLAEQLQQHGFNPIIISSCRPLQAKARSMGYATRSAWHLAFQNWSSWRLVFLPCFLLWQLVLGLRYLWLFLRLRPATINIQSRDDQIAASLAAKLLHITILWTDHADFRNWVMQNVQVKFKAPIAKMILGLARLPHRIIFVSAVDQEYFQALAPNLRNLQTVENGVVDRYGQLCAEQTEPARAEFCYLGRLDLAKGLKELILAFRTLEKAGFKTKLHLYGEGPARAELQELAQGSSRIIFHGFTDNPRAAMLACRYFVLPSYSEGLSLSLLDACMLARTIIASDVGGNPELVQHRQTGLLVPAKDVESLSAAMKELLERPEQSEAMAQAARALYLRKFNFAKIFQQKMLPLYRSQSN